MPQICSPRARWWALFCVFASLSAGWTGCASTKTAASSGPMSPPGDVLDAQIFRTSSTGNATEAVGSVQLTSAAVEATVRVKVHPDRHQQVFLGVGGSLTQASAAALSKLSPAKRQEVLVAYFGTDGAQYALSRTHVGSSDFTEYSYSYAPKGDPTLADFSVEEDEKNGLLQLIHDAQKVPGASFDLIASPWTAPPWMKDNGKYYESEKGRGGRLLEQHYETFARYMVKYIQAYRAKGIDIWALTPVNEPQGNAGTWESMEMNPEEQREYVRVLGQTLKKSGEEAKILIFDQNRVAMPEYTSVIFGDAEVASYVYGTAVHWYDSTTKVYEDILESQHAAYPDKVIIHSEGTIDSVAGEASCKQVCNNKPCGCEEMYSWWQDDAWYWKKEATDWGWDWAANREVDHPKYAPAHRYARDLVVGIDGWLAGWVDWNIVLDKRGGPNHVGNYCLAPIMVDGETDTIYYTPLFWIVRQVSRHSRPGGVVLETQVSGSEGVYAASIRNPDGSIATHLFNESGQDAQVALDLGGRQVVMTVPNAALQTVVVQSP